MDTYFFKGTEKDLLKNGFAVKHLSSTCNYAVHVRRGLFIDLDGKPFAKNVVMDRARRPVTETRIKFLIRRDLIDIVSDDIT